MRPVIDVIIINPLTGKGQSTKGVIDTGADECAVPGGFAKRLGHNLKAVKPKRIETGNGATKGYPHTTAFRIYHPQTGELVYEIESAPIDYMPRLHTVLLGVNSFLSQFRLEINYPAKTFSLIRPHKPKSKCAKNPKLQRKK